MPIVHASILPHGGQALPIYGPSPASEPLRECMAAIGASCKEADPDLILLASPHNLRVEGQLAIAASAHLAGETTAGEGRFAMQLDVDRRFARTVAEASQAAGVPAALISYATADGPVSQLPLDWGALIPLYYLADHEHPLPVCLIGPPRDLGLEPLLAIGRAIADRVGASRVAFCASCDLAHAHAEDGPYGYHPAAAQYDGKFAAAIAAGDLAAALAPSEAEREAAKPDAPWQLALLAGAIGTSVRTLRCQYVRPTYFGMMAAEFAV